MISWEKNPSTTILATGQNGLVITHLPPHCESSSGNTGQSFNFNSLPFISWHLDDHNSCTMTNQNVIFSYWKSILTDILLFCGGQSLSFPQYKNKICFTIYKWAMKWAFIRKMRPILHCTSNNTHTDQLSYRVHLFI